MGLSADEWTTSLISCSDHRLLLLLLSCFSRVRLCATPETAAHQAPPQSLGFSRQEHWSGLPFPSPMHESEKWKWKVKLKSLSRVQLLATPWIAAYQALPSMGFSRQEYWSREPLPSPSDHIGSCSSGNSHEKSCRFKAFNSFLLFIVICLYTSPSKPYTVILSLHPNLFQRYPAVCADVVKAVIWLDQTSLFTFFLDLPRW